MLRYRADKLYWEMHFNPISAASGLPITANQYVWTAAFAGCRAVYVVALRNLRGLIAQSHPLMAEIDRELGD